MMKVSPASDWCQRWESGGHTWRHTSDGGFDPRRYEVHAIDEASAKGYVLANHYSSSYPSACYRYGLFDRSALVGVAVLGVPVQAAVLTGPFPDLEPYVESLELSRLVLADAVPGNGESWFLGQVFNAAAAQGVRGLVSFADPVPRRIGDRLIFPGHVGTIYKASNAVYAGRGTPRSLTLLPNGEILNDRAKQKIRDQNQGHDYVEAKLVALGASPLPAGDNAARWLADALDTIGAGRVRHGGNHRYLFKLGITRRARQAVRIGMAAAAYPKERDAA